MTESKIICGDALEVLRTMPDGCVDCCVTSPPYFGLRNYGVDGQTGLESTPEEYVRNMVEVFREVRRVLKDEGVLFLNIGDSYCASKTGNNKQGSSTLQGGKDNQAEAQKRPNKVGYEGIKSKDLIGIPWMVAFALRADGWYLRSDIIWAKKNCMPESVKDRPTRSHEYIFLLSKSAKYYYDADAIKEPQQQSSLERLKRGWNGDGERGYVDGPHNHLKNYMGKTDEEIEKIGGRNKRDVWHVATAPFKDAHFACFPPKLIEPCILAGCSKGGVVLDPFFGAGTTGCVAKVTGRNYIGIELNPEYVGMSERRIAQYGSVPMNGKKRKVSKGHMGLW